MARSSKSIEEIILQRKYESGIMFSPKSLSTSSSSMSLSMFSPLRSPMSATIIPSLPSPSPSLSLSLSSSKSHNNNNQNNNQNNSNSHKNNVKVYPDKEMLESLLKHSQTLQIRNKELETQLLLSQETILKLAAEVESLKSRTMISSFPSRLNSSQATRNATTLEPLNILIPPSTPDLSHHQLQNHTLTRYPNSTQKHSSQSRTGPRKGNGNETHDSGAISRTVMDMEEQLMELRYMFDGINPLEERTQSAIKIQTVIRSHFAQKKYLAYRKSFQSWRCERSKKFYPILQRRLSRASRIEMALNERTVKRDYQLILAIFSRWKHICKQSAPFRLSIRNAAEEKYFQAMFRLKAQAFLALKNGTLGIDSHKHIRRERRKMIEKAKALIQANMLKSGATNLLISEVEIKRVVYREIVSTSYARRESRNKMIVFNAFKSIYLDAISHNKMAYNHKFKRYAGKCFYAWSDWTYQVGTGLERKRWTGPRKYEVRYNQKLVEHFSRCRLKKLTLGPWKRYSRVSKKINQLFMAQVSAFMRTHLLAWKNVSKRRIFLRKLTIQNWKEYPTIVMSPPFLAWKEFASSATIRRMHQDSLVNAYLRWKTRQKYIKILHTWRHQSLYGGIEGMYSRTKISKSLGEQKMMSAALQKLLTKQTIDLEECKEGVHRETMLRKKMEDRVAERDSEIEILRTKIHHLEMELKRLHGLIEAVAVINPKQVELIQSLQPDFEFRVRKLQPSLDIASEEDLFKVDDSTTTNNNKSKLFVRQGSLQSDSSNRNISRRFESPSSIPLTNSSNHNNVQTNSLPLEDRRLLARTKWLLKRLFEVEEEKQIPPPRESNHSHQNITKIDEQEEIEHNDLSAGKGNRRGSINVEVLLKNLLNDKADRKEILFVLNILSFLKDGNAKCLGEEDSRRWTAELLQSIGRNSDIVSSMMGGTKSQNDQNRKNNQSGDEFVDFDSWREILIHLRSHYPIGLNSQMANIHFQDSLESSHVGALNRVQTMRTDLQEVIQYKRQKLESTPMARRLSETVTLKGRMIEESKHISHTQGGSSINLYADNLPIQLNIQSNEPIEENLSQYDSLSLQSPSPPGAVGSSNVANLSFLYSKDLKSDFKLKS